ncbi:GDP-mannose 4,6-dehydratase, partial [Pseudomonas protegens]
MRFLITGGAGYIGSHTVLELLQAGHEAVVLDNLCNSSMLSLQRVQQITGVAPVFVQGDVCDRAILDRIFTQYEIDGVLHFAGLKAVGESVKQPLPYYQNNVSGSIT